MRNFVIAAVVAAGVAMPAFAAPSNKQLNNKIKALQERVAELEASISPDVRGRRYQLAQIGSEHGGDGTGTFQLVIRSQSHSLKFKADGTCKLNGEEFESEFNGAVGSSSGEVTADCTWTQQGNVLTTLFDGDDAEDNVEWSVANDGSVITLREAYEDVDGNYKESEVALIVGIETN